MNELIEYLEVDIKWNEKELKRERATYDRIEECLKVTQSKINKLERGDMKATEDEYKLYREIYTGDLKQYTTLLLLTNSLVERYKTQIKNSKETLARVHKCI